MDLFEAIVEGLIESAEFSTMVIENKGYPRKGVYHRKK